MELTVKQVRDNLKRISTSYWLDEQARFVFFKENSNTQWQWKWSIEQFNNLTQAQKALYVDLAKKDIIQTKNFKTRSDAVKYAQGISESVFEIETKVNNFKALFGPNYRFYNQTTNDVVEIKSLKDEGWILSKEYFNSQPFYKGWLCSKTNKWLNQTPAVSHQTLEKAIACYVQNPYGEVGDMPDINFIPV